MADQTVNEQGEDLAPSIDDFLLEWDNASGLTKKVSIQRVILLMLAGNSDWAWLTYTPTLTTISIGNGTAIIKYIELGKTVIGRIAITFGSTSTMGSGVPTFTFPVTAATYTASGPTPIGSGRASAGGVTAGGCPIRWEDTTHGDFLQLTPSGSNIIEAGFGASSPGVWAAGSNFIGTFVYQAA